LFAYLGVDYKEDVYVHGKTIESAMKPWQAKKYHLGLDFPNLPYLIDGSTKLSESKSIMKYLCRKYDSTLLGTTPEEMATADMVSRIHDTLHGKFSKHCF